MPVVRLGVACTTFNLVYHLTRRCFATLRRASKNKEGKRFTQEVELSTACALASLCLSTIAPSNDLRIMKVVIYSRFVTSLVTYIGDATGWDKPVESGGREEETRLLTTEYFLAVAGCFFLFFCYIVHPRSMVPALRRTIDRGMAMN